MKNLSVVYFSVGSKWAGLEASCLQKWIMGHWRFEVIIKKKEKAIITWDRIDVSCDEGIINYREELRAGGGGDAIRRKNNTPRPDDTKVRASVSLIWEMRCEINWSDCLMGMSLRIDGGNNREDKTAECHVEDTGEIKNVKQDKRMSEYKSE